MNMYDPTCITGENYLLPIMSFLQWITPSQADDISKAGTEIFAPPQFAEVQKLRRSTAVVLLSL